MNVKFKFAPGDVVHVPSLGITDAVIETCAVEHDMANKYSVAWLGNGTVSSRWFPEGMLWEGGAA